MGQRAPAVERRWLFGHSVIDCMKRGSKLISIDPRTNWLATRATYHLALRPGTDTALGMAMLNIIIQEDLYDHDFVDRFCYGFEQLAERVATMPAEKAAEICGLDVEDIYGATRMYANASNAAILWGLAIDQKANGAQAGHCIPIPRGHHRQHGHPRGPASRRR